MEKSSRQLWLSQEAARHAWAVAELSQEGRFGGRPDPTKRMELELWGTEAAVAALCHLQRCLRHLVGAGAPLPAEMRLQVAAFESEFNRSQVRKCRRQLEQASEFIGRGRIFAWRQAFIGQARPTLMVRPKLPYVRTFRGDFDLRSVIRIASELEAPLRAWQPREVSPRGAPEES